jgi:hypothetical protein
LRFPFTEEARLQLRAIGRPVALRTTHNAHANVLEKAQAEPTPSNLLRVQAELTDLLQNPDFLQQLKSLLPATDSSVTQTAIGVNITQIAGDGNTVG